MDNGYPMDNKGYPMDNGYPTDNVTPSYTKAIPRFTKAIPRITQIEAIPWLSHGYPMAIPWIPYSNPIEPSGGKGYREKAQSNK